MEAGRIVPFVLTGAAFALWSVLMFRALFGLLGPAEARARATGRPFPVLGARPSVFADALRAPQYRVQRRRLALATLVLFALIGAQVLLFGPTL